VYDGEFKNGKRHGRGILRDKTGKRYITVWKNDVEVAKVDDDNYEK